MRDAQYTVQGATCLWYVSGWLSLCADVIVCYLCVHFHCYPTGCAVMPRYFCIKSHQILLGSAGKGRVCGDRRSMAPQSCDPAYEAALRLQYMDGTERERAGTSDYFTKRARR